MVYLEWLPSLVVLPEPQGVSAQAAYNYFYELVIMTCNHDIAYLVRNACNANARVQSGAALGPPVRPPRGYSNNTQQIHARRETRARFDPNSLEANTCTRMSNHVTLAFVAHTQKATFHRTRNKCKREYVLPEPE